MKLLIDIPEDTHERITKPDRLFTDDDINKVCWAVYNGTPIPDNATNGDVIKAMFDEEDIWDIQTALNTHSETIGWWHSLYCED